MPRYMVLTTVKPPVAPSDTDTTFPNVYRTVGDAAWDAVNGYCKYLSKYPLNVGSGIKLSAPLLPVAGLQFQTEHVAADIPSAGTAASNWITTRFTQFAIPATWAVTTRLIYTMLGLNIGVASIDNSTQPTTL